MVVLPENHAFLPKIPILLRPVVKNKHLRLVTDISNFLMFWAFFSSIAIKTPWGIVSVKGSVARKSGFFLPTLQILLRPYSLYAYILDRNLQYFTSLMTSIYHFLVF